MVAHRCGAEAAGRRVSAAVTDRSWGAGSSPYDAGNLAQHVGDEPAVVAANRHDLAVGLGLDPGRLVWMEQVHGDRVAVVTVADAGAPVPATDALVTGEAGLALVVLVADCVPVLLADPAAGVVAAAHAGRRGLAAGVVPRTLAVMAAAGATVRRVQAWLGPSVCSLCYEVPSALCDEVAAVVPAARARSSRGTPALAVSVGVAAQLRAAGVARVERSRRCTAEDPSCFSYRRDGVTGRFAGVVWAQP